MANNDKRPARAKTRRDEYGLDDFLQSAGGTGGAWPPGGVRGPGYLVALLAGVLNLLRQANPVAMATVVPKGRRLAQLLTVVDGLGSNITGALSGEVSELADRLNIIALYLGGAAASREEFMGWWLEFGVALIDSVGAFHGGDKMRAVVNVVSTTAQNMRMSNAQPVYYQPGAPGAPQMGGLWPQQTSGGNVGTTTTVPPVPTAARDYSGLGQGIGAAGLGAVGTAVGGPVVGAAAAAAGSELGEFVGSPAGQQAIGGAAQKVWDFVAGDDPGVK